MQTTLIKTIRKTLTLKICIRKTVRLRLFVLSRAASQNVRGSFAHLLLFVRLHVVLDGGDFRGRPLFHYGPVLFERLQSYVVVHMRHRNQPYVCLTTLVIKKSNSTDAVLSNFVGIIKGGNNTLFRYFEKLNRIVLAVYYYLKWFSVFKTVNY